jgi:predicted GNAT family acetyltransferase
MNLDIAHDINRQRFTATVEVYSCVLQYSLVDGVMTINHTGVPAPVGGRGIAAELTRMAFETARINRWKVDPACSYASAYLRRHPELEAMRFRS